MKKKLTNLFLLMFLLFAAMEANAQRGIGFRFSSGFNHFYRAENFPLIDGSWSNIVVGPYYQEYFSNGGVQAGFNFIYKSNNGTGFPLVMKDFGGTHNVGVTALEFDFKAGPRFGPVNPKIGFIMGYWFNREGFFEDTTTLKLNRIYVCVPLAISAQLPTGYGSVGFGISYDIGLNNIIKNPNPGNAIGYNGSRIRSLKFEIDVLFGFERQTPKNPTPQPPAEE